MIAKYKGLLLLGKSELRAGCGSETDGSKANSVELRGDRSP